MRAQDGGAEGRMQLHGTRGLRLSVSNRARRNVRDVARLNRGVVAPGESSHLPLLAWGSSLPGDTGVYNGRRVQADAAHFKGTDKKHRGDRDAC